MSAITEDEQTSLRDVNLLCLKKEKSYQPINPIHIPFYTNRLLNTASNRRPLACENTNRIPASSPEVTHLP